MNPLDILIDILALVVGVIAGYLFQRYQADQAAKARNEKGAACGKAEATQARLTESGSRETAT